MTARLRALALLGLLASSGCDFHTGGGGTEGVGISGTLLLPDGSPAAGAKILAFAANDLGTGLVRATAQALAPVALDSAITDARGMFRLTRLDPGNYNLAPPMEVGDSALGWFRTGVAYGGGSVQLDKDTLRVSGRVGLQVLADNHVLPGATCFVPGSPYQATTDDQGTCMLSGLPPGSYRIAVAHVGYQVSQSADTAYVESGLNSNCGAVDLAESGGTSLSKRPRARP